MLTQRTSFARLTGALAAVTVTSCAQPAGDTVLGCSAGDIHHTFRIQANLQQVVDLSMTPPTIGQVSLADGSYVLTFQYRRDRYELVVVIDRATGRGTRELFDDEQQLIRGHGGFDEIVCAPVDAPP